MKIFFTAEYNEEELKPLYEMAMSCWTDGHSDFRRWKRTSL